MEKPSLNPDTWNQAVTYLGEDFVRFILACRSLPNAVELEGSRLEAAKLILSALAGCNLSEWDELRKMEHILSAFCSYHPQFQSSLAVFLHFHCGGPKPDTSAADQLEELICQLACDAYPSFLIPKPEGFSSLSSHIHVHPLRKKAEEVIFTKDEPLMKLFPHADFGAVPEPGTGRDWQLASQVTWSDGSMQTLQMIQLPELILRKSCGALQGGKSALESYIISVRETLARARALASGETVEVPALAGCYSASFASDLIELRLTQGRFRAKTPMDHNLVRGNESVVLELPTAFSMVKNPSPSNQAEGVAPPSANEMASIRQFHEGLHERISKARMAVLLSSNSGEVLAIGQSFLTVVNPLASGHSHSVSPLAWPMAPFQSRALEQSDEVAIQKWDALLAAMPKGLRTGRDRLLAAVSERYSPYDGFVDAVIVWENLFGAAGETGLRVCGSLARLLHPSDPDARSEMFKEAKSMYDKRSKLVHGGPIKMTTEQATSNRDDAVHIAIQAWREVISTDGLRTVDDSASRSNLVLLGI